MVDTPGPDEEMSFLLSITGSMAKICAASLQEIELSQSDKGVAGLVIKYAQQIDAGNMTALAKYGPMLLQAMEALQMSPRSRSQSSKGVLNATKPTTKLDELRIKREERKNRTPDIHAATS